MGCKAEQFDQSLPQRRLAVFASQRQTPLLDLLPHFRAAGESVHVRNDHLWNERGNQLAADVIATWLEHSYANKLMDAPQVSAR